MPDTILSIRRAHQRRDGGHGLRVRAVLYEDAKARPPQPPQKHRQLPSAHLLAAVPHVADYCERHGQLPSVTRSARNRAPRIGRAHAMHRHGGELVFVRFSMPSLDGLDLRAPDLATQARVLVRELLRRIAPGALAFDVAVQRGGKYGGTHAHLLLPVAFLTPLLRRKVRRAPRGEGGGVLHSPDLHLVLLDDSEEDRAKVATYMGRDGDGRLDLPADHPDHLQALEDRLTRAESPRLQWQRLPPSWRSP